MAEIDRQKPRRLWRVIFALSLAMNVAVVGVVAGLGAREKGRGVSPRGFDMALGPVGRALSGEDRRAIGEALRRDLAVSRGGRAQSRAMVDEMVAVLRSAPFDAGALAEVVAGASARSERVQSAARAALVLRISQMSDADRLALADRLEQGQGRGR
jgi:uncharacterized membrane protein